MGPSEGTQEPCAVHVVQNRPTAPTDQLRICENPRHHTVLASSGVAGADYLASTEVGAVCNIPKDGEAIVVIPSLETKKSEGKYMLRFLATEDIIVERVV